MKASVCAGINGKIYPMRHFSRGKTKADGLNKSIEGPYEPEQEEIVHATHIKSKSIDAFSDLDQLSSRRALKNHRKILPVSSSFTLSSVNNSAYGT